MSCDTGRMPKRLKNHPERKPKPKGFWEGVTSVRHVPNEDPPAEIPPITPELRALMSALGRKGGKISGAKRMENRRPSKRKQIAKRAALARWKKAESESN